MGSTGGGGGRGQFGQNGQKLHENYKSAFLGQNSGGGASQFQVVGAGIPHSPLTRGNPAFKYQPSCAISEKSKKLIKKNVTFMAQF